MSTARIRSLAPSALVALSLLGVALAVFFSSPGAARSQGVAAPITGYLWSDTIGWVDLNCSNSGVCGTNNFGLSVAGNGDLSGYAWSDNVGWISANKSDLGGCPSPPCKAGISGDVMSGWMKVLAGGSAQSGGWDGFISLSGSGYGVTLNETTGAFMGYAWGDTNLGWVDWSQARSGFSEIPPCQATQGYFCQGNDLYLRDAQCATSFQNTCSYQCVNGACVPPPAPQGGLSGGAAITALPALVSSGGTVTVNWSIANVTSCSVIGTNGDSWTGASGTKTSSPITAQTTYTLTCTGVDGSTFRQSAVVNLIPTFHEI